MSGCVCVYVWPSVTFYLKQNNWGLRACVRTCQDSCTAKFHDIVSNINLATGILHSVMDGRTLLVVCEFCGEKFSRWLYCCFNEFEFEFFYDVEMKGEQAFIRVIVSRTLGVCTPHNDSPPSPPPPTGVTSLSVFCSGQTKAERLKLNR